MLVDGHLFLCWDTEFTPGHFGILAPDVPWMPQTSFGTQFEALCSSSHSSSMFNAMARYAIFLEEVKYFLKDNRKLG